LRGIYVGGISSRYGINILLDAFDLVNKKQRLELIIVCRKNEYNVLDSSTIEKIKRNWIKVYHVSGDDLKDLYYKSDFGIIPRLKDDYNIIAMPVKLFEYLSYGIPIVATNCLEMEKFINKHQCGVICEDNSKSLAEAISKINNKEYYEILCNNAQGTILDGNLWADRVKSIVEIMTHDQNS
jgi:glycosyltransferase involved in cell wall biosynthesis